jgi:GAF domain-containing protein
VTALDRRARDVFATLADTLVDEFDVLDFLDMFAERCVELLDVAAAGLLLVDHEGAVRLVGASTRHARRLHMLQLRHRKGPSLAAYHRGEAVHCPDLTATPWPRFAEAAATSGYAAVHVLPMRLRADVIGGLSLFTSAPGELDEERIGLAQALADTATIGILQERIIRQGETLVRQLQTALDSRVLIEQAKGVLSERLHITVAAAFTLLRTHARNTSQRLIALAAAVVDGSADTAAIVGAETTSSHT